MRVPQIYLFEDRLCLLVFVLVDCQWWSSRGRLVGESPTVPVWSALAFSPDTTLEQIRGLGGVLDCRGMDSQHVVSIVWVVPSCDSSCIVSCHRRLAGLWAPLLELGSIHLRREAPCGHADV